MGGLTARAYIQNPDFWQSDGQHHIAKLQLLVLHMAEAMYGVDH